MPSLLEMAGNAPDHTPKFTPIFLERFFTGLWLQRAPIRDPSGIVYAKYYGGRPDALIAGVNVELTNNLTLARRPGTSQFSAQGVFSAVNSFYSFKQFTSSSENITVMADTPATIFSISPASVTPVFAKSSGAGFAYFLGIGNTLYIGDGVDQVAWQGYGVTLQATITTTVLTSDVATYTADNNFVVGNVVTVTGTTNGGGVFNVTNRTITAATASSFQVSPVFHANVGSASDTGTAVAGSVRGWGIAATGGSSSSKYAGTGTSGTGTNNQSQGPNSGGAAVSAGSGAIWNFPEAALDGGGSYSSTNVISAFGQTQQLEASQYGFNVPSGATITGILVTASGGAGNFGVIQSNIFLLQNGSTVGDNRSTGMTAQGNLSWGDSLDLWGTSWIAGDGTAPNDVNNTNFGASIQFADNTGSSNFASCGSIQITVYYTTTSGTVWVNPANIEGSPDAVYSVASLAGSFPTAILFASDYGFAVTGTVVGIQINVTGHVASGTTNPILYAQLQDNNGNAIGSRKSFPLTSITDTVTTFGSSSDLWNTSLLTADIINDSGNLFGVQLSASGSGAVLLDSAQITVFTIPNPTAAVTMSIAPATITNTSLTSNVATYTATNSFSAGQLVTVMGSTNAAGTFNVIAQPILGSGLSGSQFEVALVSPDIVSAGDTGTATVGLTGLYTYGYAYGNSYGVVSNIVGTVQIAPIGATEITVNVTASPDPQVTQIILFRTVAEGTILERVPIVYANATAGIIDPGTPDSALIFTQLGAQSLENSPPPQGLIGMVYYLGRPWGFVDNTVYYATGPDLGNILGNGNESWNPENVFVYPSKVTKLVPVSVGLLVFTVSDVYIIYGNASATAVQAATNINASGLQLFYSAPFLADVGLLSPFALDVNGTTIYLLTADGQCLSIDPSAGISEIGFPIASPNIAYPNDPNLSATSITVNGTTQPSYATNNSLGQVYLTWHVSGSIDKAVYLSDGTNGWFRCNTSQSPDGGFVWSPMAQITGGCQAVQSIETSPGKHQLLIGPGPSGGAILTRNLQSFSDNGTAYPANFIMGSITLAQPGQLAEVGFVTCDFNRVGTSPLLGVLFNEISGTFSNLARVIGDPPALYGATGNSLTLFANRYYTEQTVLETSDGVPVAPLCRHMQIRIDYGAVDTTPNELLSLTLFGCHYVET